jgi:hypothetical protein
MIVTGATIRPRDIALAQNIEVYDQYVDAPQRPLASIFSAIRRSIAGSLKQGDR